LKIGSRALGAADGSSAIKSSLDATPVLTKSRGLAPLY
jgi:hypothetical protein